MKLVMFWLLGVPASVGLLLAGFPPERGSQDSRPAYLHPVRAPQACASDDIILPSQSGSRATCSPRRGE